MHGQQSKAKHEHHPFLVEALQVQMQMRNGRAANRSPQKDFHQILELECLVFDFVFARLPPMASMAPMGRRHCYSACAASQPPPAVSNLFFVLFCLELRPTDRLVRWLRNDIRTYA